MSQAPYKEREYTSKANLHLTSAPCWAPGPSSTSSSSSPPPPSCSRRLPRTLRWRRVRWISRWKVNRRKIWWERHEWAFVCNKSWLHTVQYWICDLMAFIQIDALQEVLEKLRNKEMPSEKKLGWLPSVSPQFSPLMHLFSLLILLQTHSLPLTAIIVKSSLFI